MVLRPRRDRGPTLLLADLARAAGVLSLAVAAVWWGPVGVAVFALVLLGLVLPRVAAVPAGLDLACGVVLLAAAWFSFAGLYAAVAWLDLVVHLAATGLVAALAHTLLVRGGALPSPDASVVHRPRLGIVVTTAALGLALGAAWEMGEWAGHTFIDGAISVGYDDTIGDLVAGGLGALTAGVALARAPGRRTAGVQPRATVRQPRATVRQP
ncbi:hypothetical protein [Georgenia sp. SYP-B2076]|uniref:hypothetical protein n=1 Tax=Georgenia sp. SYP-B2076 TaxID=2495881 RepID=UPI000F8EC3D4|nr:hypothetical protein [Georgenia sp. SYP-B2076]